MPVSTRLLRTRTTSNGKRWRTAGHAKSNKSQKWNCEDSPPTQILRTFRAVVPCDQYGKVSQYGTSDEPCAPAGHRELTLITAQRDALLFPAVPGPLFTVPCRASETTNVSRVPAHVSTRLHRARAPSDGRRRRTACPGTPDKAQNMESRVLTSSTDSILLSLSGRLLGFAAAAELCFSLLRSDRLAAALFDSWAAFRRRSCACSLPALLRCPSTSLCGDPSCAPARH